jgi:hypothetical protein
MYLWGVGTHIYIKVGLHTYQMAYIVSAKYVFHVESQLDVVEVEYTKHIPGHGWKNHKDYVYSYPEGDWTSITFGEDSAVKYVDFLRSMVYNNTDVLRKMARISLNDIDKRYSYHKMIRVVNAIKIMDHTFEPPTFNAECKWQTELLEHLALHVVYKIIDSCKNKKRLRKISRAFQLI